MSDVDLTDSGVTETKNTWARDDPAILILISACLTGACIPVWGPICLCRTFVCSLRCCVVNSVVLFSVGSNSISVVHDNS